MGENEYVNYNFPGRPPGQKVCVVYVNGKEVELPATAELGGQQLYDNNKNSDFAGILKALDQLGITDPNARVNIAGHWWDDPWSAFNGYTRAQVQHANTLSAAQQPAPANPIPPVETNPAPITWTEPIKVATYNAAGWEGVGAKTKDDVRALGANVDIMGLQEVESKEMHDLVAELWDTHEPYVGQAIYGGYKGIFQPIFYNKNRFEAVFTETIWLHEPNFQGSKYPRNANFIILKEKSTGATMLVVNTHWANEEVGRVEACRVINEKIAKIAKEYPLDNITVMGDFNTDNHGNFGFFNGTVTPGKFPGGVQTYVGSDPEHLIDMICTNAQSPDEFHAVTDGGESDHNIVSRAIKFHINNDPRKSTLLPANQGGMLFEAPGYQGDEWIVGFGTPYIINNDWNDRVSSIRLEDSTVFEVYNHSERDPDASRSTDYHRIISEDTRYLGADFDNMISQVRFWRK